MTQSTGLTHPCSGPSFTLLPLPHNCWPSTSFSKPSPDSKAPGLGENPRPSLPGGDSWIISSSFALAETGAVYPNLICPRVAIALLLDPRTGSPTTSVTSFSPLKKKLRATSAQALYPRVALLEKSKSAIWADSTIHPATFSSPFLLGHFWGLYWTKYFWCLLGDRRLYLRYIHIITPSLYRQPLPANTEMFAACKIHWIY